MTHPLTFVVLSSGTETLAELRSHLSADSRTKLLMAGSDPDQAYAEITRFRPSAAIITLGASPEQDLTLVGRIAAECPQTVIICASREGSPDLILRSLRAGAREYLRLPIIAEEFRTVLDRTAEFSAGHTHAAKRRGRAIAVFSSKGGCGTSFIATNLAAAMGEQTVLVDLNLQSGNLGLFLGIEPQFSIADLVENRRRIDDALLKSYLAQYSTNMSFLAAPREVASAEDIEPEHIFEVMQLLRERYDYLVFDTQHTFDSVTLAALDQADDILLVLTLDIPSIKSAQRALAIFDRLGYPRGKVHVVVNRWTKQNDFDVRQVELSLGQRIVGFIPNDYRATMESINLGKVLVEAKPSSAIAVEMRRIAATLTGVTAAAPEAEPARRKLSSLFRRPAAATNTSGFDLRATPDKV